MDRKDIITKAYNECMSEMYAKAQPPADYQKYCDDIKNGIIVENRDDTIYNRHYLSYDEFMYILEKYQNAYGITEKWHSNMQVVKDYFNGGGLKDVWVDKYVDDAGVIHPGYRKVEDVPNIKESIKEMLKNKYKDVDSTMIANDVYDMIIEYLNDCEDFYRFDREKESFSATIALGCSPTSNKETVKEYWKKQGKDIIIKERNPLLFLEMDEDGEAFEEVMKEDYGDNWEDYWWQEYYKTDKGKKKLCEDYIKAKRKDNSCFDNVFVSTNDKEELVITTYDNYDKQIPIDDYIKEHNIDYKKFI